MWLTATTTTITTGRAPLWTRKVLFAVICSHFVLILWHHCVTSMPVTSMYLTNQLRSMYNHSSESWFSWTSALEVSLMRYINSRFTYLLTINWTEFKLIQHNTTWTKFKSLEEEEEEILFCQTKHNKKTTHIAHNHGRLPEKGLRPSKLATYCITQQNTKNTNVQLCKNVQKNKWWTQNTDYDKTMSNYFYVKCGIIHNFINH